MTTFEHSAFFKFNRNIFEVGGVPKNAFDKKKVEQNRKGKRLFNEIW